MKASKKPNGRTGTLLWWPLFLSPILIAAAVMIIFMPQNTYYVLAGTGVSFGLFLLIWFIYWKKNFREELIFFAQSFNEIQTSQLEKIEVATALVNGELEILWCNKSFTSIFKREASDNISSFNENLIYAIKDVLADETKKVEPVRYEEGLMSIRAEVINTEGQATIYFFDETELNKRAQIIDDMNPGVALVLFDNYEEISSKLDDLQKSVLVAHVQKIVTEYFIGFGAIVSATDRCNYSVNLDNKTLKKIREDKFSILEKIRTANTVGKSRPTLSIGLGIEGKDITENLKFAKDAMNLCLGRGGDQAIVKTPEGKLFYGGKTESKEKTTRLKVRNFANALKNVILEKDHILVMAHRMPDADAFGAAIGIYKIAKGLGKNASIVINEIPGGIKPIYENVMEEAEPDEKIVITKKEALEINKDTAAIVLVDVNRPSIAEDIELYEKIKTRVIIDHHRLSEERFKDPTITCIEPYASSASEIVCELLQYISNDNLINSSAAEALYAGIIVDSDNFLTKTGFRTFEAAAFLKKSEADPVKIRKLLRDGKKEFLAKTEAVASSKIYKERYAFGHCAVEGVESPTIIGAKVANELLDIRGVRASFVFTPYEGKIYISARSIDEVNVQRVMENLGGGGHLSVAGAQLADCTLEEAVEKTKAVIDKMESEGEI